MSPSKLKRKYQKRILGILNKMAKCLQESGHKAEGPKDFSVDDYRWCLLVNWDWDKNDGVDITFKICESEEYDGEKGGVNFAVGIVESGGRILGELCPYNYTDDVWVPRKDHDAVEERFRLLENVDPEGMVECVERAYA